MATFGCAKACCRGASQALHRQAVVCAVRQWPRARAYMEQAATMRHRTLVAWCRPAYARPMQTGVAWVCPTIAVCGLSICKDKINRREYKKNGLVFKPAPPPGRHRQSDSGRKHGRAGHVVQPKQKKKCPPGPAATAPPGGHHPSCQVAVGNQPISSCSKSTDTIDLAGAIYIFATILCALGQHTNVSSIA